MEEHSGQITENQGLWNLREENHLEPLYKFKWAMKTIIAGKYSSPVLDKKMQKEIIWQPSGRGNIIYKEKLYSFTARKTAALKINILPQIHSPFKCCQFISH